MNIDRPSWSRRDFLKGIGASSVAVAGAVMLPEDAEAQARKGPEKQVQGPKDQFDISRFNSAPTGPTFPMRRGAFSATSWDSRRPSPSLLRAPSSEFSYLAGIASPAESISSQISSSSSALHSRDSGSWWRILGCNSRPVHILRTVRSS